MSKSKLWLIWSLIMGLGIIGCCWWIAWTECKKACPKMDNIRISNTPQWTTNFIPPKEIPVYQGKWHKDYLEVIGK